MRHVLPTLALTATVTFVTLAAPTRAHACACGCGIFNVGIPYSMATSSGGEMYLKYSFMNQNKNWNGFRPSNPSNNDDKHIRTHFFALGARYMFNRTWGLALKLPVWDRYLKTTSSGGALVSADHWSLSDMTVMGLYTGLSEDMSTGFEIGLRLPTGPTDLSGFDPDTQPGYGSTSLLLGFYHMGSFGKTNTWGWWLQALIRNALYTAHGYHPGDSYNASFGVHYDGLAAHYFIPMLNVTASVRGRDSGSQADPDNTGFQRLFLTPGFEVPLPAGFSLFADVPIAVMTHNNGQQLVAPWMVSSSVSYAF